MAQVAPVGLDIGSVSVRAVEVTRSKDRTVIENFGQASLPEGAMVGGVVKDERAVTTTLRGLWATQKFRTKSVVLGVTHQQVVVREVEIANLPAKEMRQSLPFQVRDALPLPVEQAMLDFYPLEEAAKTKESVRGLVIAVPKEAVIDTVRAVEKAGLHVHNVDLACFAMLRAVAATAQDTAAIIDIGANDTNIVIHSGGIPKIVRTIPRGGHEITKLVASRLNISVADAEALKCRVGISAAGGDPDADVVAEAARPLVGEIRSSLTYYANQEAAGQVSHLALVGGSSHLPGLTERLSFLTGVPAVIADPLQHVGDSRRGGRHDVLGRFRTSAAVSIGLTIGGGVMTDVLSPAAAPVTAGQAAAATPEPVVVRIRANLLPDEVIGARRLAKLKRRLAAALVLVVVLLAGGYAYSWWQTGNAETDLAAAQASADQLTAQAQQYGPLVAAQSHISQLQGELAQAMQGDLQWSPLMSTLRNAARGRLSVTAISATVTPPGAADAAQGAAPLNPLNSTGLQLVGSVTISGTTPDYQAVAAYVDALGKVKGLTVVDPASVTHTPGSYTFSITLSLTTDALGGRFTPTTTTPAPATSTSSDGGS